MAFFRSITLFSMLLLVNNSGSLSGQQTDTAPAQKPVGVKSMSLPGLDNVFQVDEAVYSGSGPAEQRSFDALQKLGVKTIVSVDGTEPHLEMARRAGMRYVHIPIGYDGVSNDAGLAFARVAKEIKGTSKDYAGLWRDIRNFKIPPADTPLPKLVESTPVSPLVKAMSQISHHFESLDQMQTQNQHPLVRKKNRETLVLLKEEFREAARKYSDDYDEMFQKWMRESEKRVDTLQTVFQKDDQKQMARELK
ncbi:unnamed protein product, partial [Symbiodinium microadriaticum]